MADSDAACGAVTYVVVVRQLSYSSLNVSGFSTNLRTAFQGGVLLWWFAAVATAQSRDSDLDRYSDDARQALAAKEWHTAEQALEHLAQLAPSVAEVQANLGLALFFEGRAGEALAAFERAQKLNPSLRKLEVMGGLCKAELGRYSEAAAVLAPAFEHPNDEETDRLIGLHLQRSYTELKEFDKAQAVGEELIKRYSKDPEILYQVSRLHADRSYQLMKQLMQAAPESCWVHLANGQVQESMGRYDLAQQEYRKAIQQNPAVPGAHYRLGYAILKGPRDPQAVDEAVHEFERELALEPQNAAAEFELGEIARERGQLDLARRHLTKAVRYNSDFFEPRIGLARLLLKQGNPRDAVGHLEQAVRLAPGDTLPHYLLAAAYRSLGDSAGARREMEIYRKLRASGNRPAAADDEPKEP